MPFFITDLDSVVKEYASQQFWKTQQYLTTSDKIKVDWSDVEIENCTKYFKAIHFNKSKTVISDKSRSYTVQGNHLHFKEELDYDISLLSHFRTKKNFVLPLEIPSIIMGHMKISNTRNLSKNIEINTKLNTRFNGKMELISKIYKPTSFTDRCFLEITGTNKEFHSGFIIESQLEGSVKMTVNKYSLEKPIQNILKKGLCDPTIIEVSNNICNYTKHSSDKITLNTIGTAAFRYPGNQEVCISKRSSYQRRQ